MQWGSGTLQLKGEEHDPVWIIVTQGVGMTNIPLEFVVMNKSTSRKQATFSEDGGSGAFVLDHESHIYGLLYGGISSFMTGMNAS